MGTASVATDTDLRSLTTKRRNQLTSGKKIPVVLSKGDGHLLLDGRPRLPRSINRHSEF
jgi:hypothetical protein